MTSDSFLSPRPTLGQRLRAQREALGLSIAVVARELKIDQKYVQALEKDDYAVFSARVYLQGFLRRLLPALSFPNSEEMLHECEVEWEIHSQARRNALASFTPHGDEGRRPLTLARIAFWAGMTLAAGMVIFFGIRLLKFTAAPQLLIAEPAPEVTLHQPRVRVRGFTQKESQLTVNGRELTIDESGGFDQEIELIVGLNTLEFLSRDKFGKETRRIRYVAVE